VNGYLERSFRCIHFESQRRVWRVRLTEKEHLQPLEMFRPWT
jgi:hypothetical protein